MAVSPSPLSFSLDAENFNRFLEEREEIGRWYKSRLLGVWKRVCLTVVMTQCEQKILAAEPSWIRIHN